jgi:hypothetical protein
MTKNEILKDCHQLYNKISKDINNLNNSLNNNLKTYDLKLRLIKLKRNKIIKCLNNENKQKYFELLSEK